MWIRGEVSSKITLNNAIKYPKHNNVIQRGAEEGTGFGRAMSMAYAAPHSPTTTLPFSSFPAVFVSCKIIQRHLFYKHHHTHKTRMRGHFDWALPTRARMHGKKDNFQMKVLENRSENMDTFQGGQDIANLKKAVIQAVAKTNRGKDTTAEQKQIILRQIEALEACNPTTNPVDSHLLSGLWSLLYTAATDGEMVDKYAGAEEGPFLARLKPFAFRSVRQTASFQVIDTTSGSVQNIADFIIFGIKGKLVIKGKAIKSTTLGKEHIRLDVTFESFFLRIGDWQTPIIQLDWINPAGWVDTTFLDDDLRIGRGDKGSIFVSARVNKNEILTNGIVV